MGKLRLSAIVAGLSLAATVRVSSPAQSPMDAGAAARTRYQGQVAIWYGSHFEDTASHDWGPIKEWNGPFHPLLGEYKTSDPEIVRQHLRWLRRAGVDVVFYDVCRVQPELTLLDLPKQKTLQLIVGELSRQDRETRQLKLVLWLEKWNANPTAEQYRFGLDYIREHLAQSAFYFRLDGKPLVVTYLNGASPEIDALDREYAPFLTIRRLSPYPNVKGWRYFGPAGDAECMTVNPGADGFMEEAFIAKYVNKQAIDDEAYRKRGQAAVEQRAGGRTFEDQLLKARQVDPQIIFISGWNDWAWCLQIEPAKEYGFQYVDIAARLLGREAETRPYRDRAPVASGRSPRNETGLAQTEGTRGVADVQGRYFAKKAYVPRPLPVFAATKALLPAPRFDDHPGYVDMYWKAWELAFRNFHEPAAGTGFVSAFIDAAFNQNIFAWDTCFMTLFTNTAHPLVPGIASLDNFYARQHEDGEICREIDRSTGRDYKAWINPGQPLYSAWGFNIDASPPPVTVQYVGREAPRAPSRVTLDGLDHPLFAWAEMESYRTTGDKARLRLIYEPLVRFYRSLQEYLRQGNGLYMTDWASMDNSPRNSYLNRGGTGIDISCEMALIAREMAEMARTIGRPGEGDGFDREADSLAVLINRLMWDPEKHFYYDLTVDGRRAPIKTVAGFWALLAGVAGEPRASSLSSELENPATFGRLHPVPTAAADQPLYNPKGEYWRGSAWAPTTTMVVRGLERSGYHRQARAIARKDLEITYQVFAKTGTVWENYAPDSAEPGNMAKRDFVGWSGIGPILFLLEYGLGLKPDAPGNALAWDIQAGKRLGCDRYRFNGHVVDLDAAPDAAGTGWSLTVRSDGDFTLRASAGSAKRAFSVHKGENRFVLGAGQRGPAV